MITGQVMWQKTSQNGPKAATIYLSKVPNYVSNDSERELEILQRIAEGLTNQEVATKLYLSLQRVGFNIT